MAQTFAIRKGVPIKRPRSVYPFEAMDVGDCFDAPDDMGEVAGHLSKSARRHSILSSARNYKTRADRPEFAVTTSLLREDGRNIVRCWRTA